LAKFLAQEGQCLLPLLEMVEQAEAAVSRECIEASVEALRTLAERRLDILVVYLDGQQFGSHHVLTALGVDAEGRKHVLSLAEGASENATVVTGLLEALRRCLGTTNLIESPQSGVRRRTRRVTRWRDGAMALRWAATAWVATEKRFRPMMGYKHLWMLKACLDDEPAAGTDAD